MFCLYFIISKLFIRLLHNIFLSLAALSNCSIMFIAGKPVKNDQLHPDSVPSIFPHLPGSKVKAQLAIQKYNRHMQLQEKRQIQEPELMTPLSPSPPSSPASSSTVIDHHEHTIQQMQAEIDGLKLELHEVKRERDMITRKYENTKLRAGCVKGDDVECKELTGLTWQTFIKTFQYLSSSINIKVKTSLSFMDQFFLMLIKLKTDLSFSLISRISGVGITTVRDYFWKWLDISYANLHFLIRYVIFLILKSFKRQLYISHITQCQSVSNKKKNLLNYYPSI